jgi:hypothetical protein
MIMKKQASPTVLKGQITSYRKCIMKETETISETHTGSKYYETHEHKRSHYNKLQYTDTKLLLFNIRNQVRTMIHQKIGLKIQLAEGLQPCNRTLPKAISRGTHKKLIARSFQLSSATTCSKDAVHYGTYCKNC